MIDKLIRPWDEEYEYPDDDDWDEEAELEELYKVVQPSEFVFAVHRSKYDDFRAKIFVSVSPKSFWEREQCQWDQHLSVFIDVRKLKLEEALEATFDYMGESVEICTAELTAYGMIHDSKFQETMNRFY